ncbi:hypothetical protein AKUH3B110M_TOXIN200160 (plasmid) [Apilactobacillus kunkeei]|nr:hypothetical protein AKUH3B110M_TOXIN200160 [Apilactobacillus kunkeei]
MEILSEFWPTGWDSLFYYQKFFIKECSICTQLGNKLRQKAKENGLKMYEVAMLVNSSYSSFYTTYMHSNDDKKLQKVINAIDEYMKRWR